MARAWTVIRKLCMYGGINCVGKLYNCNDGTYNVQACQKHINEKHLKKGYLPKNIRVKL
jgi:hypothetical protein